MHDQTYFRELKISNKENGYRDIIAKPDLKSFRRIPWENNVPFFLVSFYDPDTGKSLSACPRSVLQRAVGNLEKQGLGAMAGGEHDRANKSHSLIKFESTKSTYADVEQRSTSSTNTRHPQPNHPLELSEASPRWLHFFARTPSLH